MDYMVLTLPEATGLYMGLALQAAMRNSSLAYAPYILMVLGGLHLLWRVPHLDRPGVGIGIDLGSYAVISLVLVAVFWPEITPFGQVHPLQASAVASYTASQDEQATMHTAAETGEVDGEQTFLSPGFRLMLPFLTDTPLTFARLINQQTHRVFNPTITMSWLLGLDVTTDVTRALADWIEACWKPSMLQDQEFQEAINASDLLPWGNTPVARALATREAVPGAMTGGGYFRPATPLGLLFLSNPGSPTVVRCDVYLSAVELDVQRWLFDPANATPAGTPLSQVFEEDLGLTVAQQGRFLVYREILRALGRPSPVPSLVGAYGMLSAARVGTGALGGALQARGGWLGGLFGAGAGAVNQFERVLDRLLWTVGLAMWFIEWAPFIFGITLYVLISLFGVVFCYSLIPRTQFRPLVTYFLSLLYVCFAPLWFAMVDAAARAAASLAPQTEDAILSTLNWAPAQFYSVVTTIIGLVVVLSVGARVLFMSARGMIGALRP
jgi:hypothetical protein